MECQPALNFEGFSKMSASNLTGGEYVRRKKRTKDVVSLQIK